MVTVGGYAKSKLETAPKSIFRHKGTKFTPRINHWYWTLCDSSWFGVFVAHLVFFRFRSGLKLYIRIL